MQHFLRALPPRGAQCQRPLNLRPGDLPQHVAADRRDNRQDHDRQHEPAAEHIAARERQSADNRLSTGRRGFSEQPGIDAWNPTKPAADCRFNVMLKKWSQHKQSPHAIRNRGNRSQKLDQERHGRSHPTRAQPHQEQRRAKAQRYGEHKRQHRADRRAINRRQGPKLRWDRPHHGLPALDDDLTGHIRAGTVNSFGRHWLVNRKRQPNVWMLGRAA